MNTRQYFQSHTGYFWQWEDFGAAIAIPGGRTIAYSQYLLQALKLLQPQGLPRFGSLLLAFVATNPEAEEDLLQATDNLKSRLLSHRHGLSYDCKYHLEVIGEGLEFLLDLAKLPQEYKREKKRLQVLQALFAGAHNLVSAKKAKIVLDVVRESGPALEKLMGKKDFDPGMVLIDFRPLALLRGRYPTAEAILQEMGRLPEVEEDVLLPGEHPQPEPETGDLVRELLEDSRTFHVGALIPRIWSGLDIPIHHRVPAGQPFGGMSGLSNKGDFHRLLISELAHDDIVFLSRLANNEALYFNREAPPQADNRERVILIDVSIKSWGTPRIMAFALLLAIARHPKTDIPCSAFALGDGIYPLAFGNIHEVIESLQVMDACLHPASGLERFFREHPEKQKAEVILISPEDTLQLPALQPALEAHHAHLDYWIQTDSQGRIALYKKQQLGRKHLKTMQLPLQQLWDKKQPKRKRELPGMGWARYPLLFLSPSRIRALFLAGGELFQATPERMLLRNAGKDGQFWELLYENLPAGADCFEMGQAENKDIVLLASIVNKKELFLLNLTKGTQQTIHLDRREPRFVFHEGAFYSTRSPLYIEVQPDGQAKARHKGEIGPEMIRMLDGRRQARLERAKKNIRFYESILKNIKAVFINQEYNLMFNAHELRYAYDQFTLLPARPLPAARRAQARRTGKNEFTFPDGSQVLVNPAGMLILKSSDSSLPPVYVPSVLNKPLGLSARGRYAGNSRFFPAGCLVEEPMSPKKFWFWYIRPFIKTIVQHGTKA